MTRPMWLDYELQRMLDRAERQDVLRRVRSDTFTNTHNKDT